MNLVILDPDELKRIIRRRRKTGADRYDEVWDEVYVMSPIADNSHQELAFRIAARISEALGEESGARISAGANFSDRKLKWKKNYRVPDVAVYLPGNPAEDMGSFWHGGPDFAVEIIGHCDRSREKLDFYAKVGVRELLLVDRNPWALELYRLQYGHLGRVEADPDGSLTSQAFPIRLRLTADEPTPRIAIEHSEDGRRWLI